MSGKGVHQVRGKKGEIIKKCRDGTKGAPFSYFDRIIRGVGSGGLYM